MHLRACFTGGAGGEDCTDALTLTLEPASPATASTATGGAVTGIDGTSYTGATPRLYAAATDANGDTVRLDFEVSTATGTVLWTGSVSGVSAGKQGAIEVPAGTLADGQAWRWRARGFDGIDYGPWSDDKSYTVDTTRTFATTGPVMEGATVKAITKAGALTAPRGVAVISQHAFVADANRIMKIDTVSGEATVLAGSASVMKCTDATSGADARFYWPHPRVVGTDGTLIYVYDGTCGLRAVHPDTGATTTVKGIPTAPPGPGYPPGTNHPQDAIVAGDILYGIFDNDLYRYDRTDGTWYIVATGLPPGAKAADDTHVWVASNDALYRIDLATGITTTVASLTLPSSPSALLSVGDYLYAGVGEYYSGGSRALVRISKRDGTHQLIAGTTERGFLTNISGIASDGVKLYVTDIYHDSLNIITPASRRSLAPVATAPVLAAGAASAVTAPGALRGSANGVTVIGQHAFVADRFIDGSTYQAAIRKIDIGSGEVSTLVEAVPFDGCQHVDENARVVGTDGTLIYVLDDCGLRAVHPVTGAISRDLFGGNHAPDSAVVAGDALYTTYDGSSTIHRFDLTNGTARALTTSVPYSSLLAADDSHVWLTADKTLYRVDASTGASTTIASLALPSVPSALLSVGDYLYANTTYTDTTDPDDPITYFHLYRISKTNGFAALVSSSPLIGAVNALASDGTLLYLAEGPAKRLLAMGKAKLPTEAGGPSLPGETVGGNNPAIGGTDPSQTPACNACHGDPVQTDTGALLEPVTDLRLSDQARALEMARTYSSAAAGMRSVLGYGWAWPYGMTVTEPAPGQVLVTQETAASSPSVARPTAATQPPRGCRPA
ncbi:DUF6531 domain-containing protein [Planobispora siamensis]|uniref:DUF6531 domain-containing protein n=1 Tax=Planobispora siamensis TaxID=936338 RepID=UPI0035EBECCB